MKGANNQHRKIGFSISGELLGAKVICLASESTGRRLYCWPSSPPYLAHLTCQAYHCHRASSTHSQVAGNGLGDDEGSLDAGSYKEGVI